MSGNEGPCLSWHKDLEHRKCEKFMHLHPKALVAGEKALARERGPDEEIYLQTPSFIVIEREKNSGEHIAILHSRKKARALF